MVEKEQLPNIEKNTPPSKKRGVVVSVQFKARSLNWQTNFNGGPTRRRKPYQVTLWSWMAALIDASILFGLSCLFLVVFAKIVQTPAFSVVKVIRSKSEFFVIFGQIFFVSSWFYLVLLRSLFGGTIGEYTCDLRLGHPSVHGRPGYLWRVMLRSSLIVGMGLVVLPIISLFVGFDLVGRATGLRLYTLK